jgi:4-amino-4-deoxy-L-arabinose transferase-like glycosyltransferase
MPVHKPADSSASSTTTKTNNKSEIIVESAAPAKLRGLAFFTGPMSPALLGPILLGLMSILTFFFGLGSAPLLGPDEPRYAEVAREMFVTHDYITPRLCGCPWFEKPVLLYWMSALSYKLIGVGEFAARLPSSICAIATAAFLYFALARRQSKRRALICAAVLITSPLFIGYARAAVTDMPLTAALAIALISFYLSATTEGRSRAGWWIAAWAFVGVTMLAKGLVGPVLFAGVVVLTLLICRNGDFNNWKYWIGGIAVFLSVSLTWYLPVISRNGYPFIREFFINHHFKRYLTNEYHHPEPIYFYPAILLSGLLPWSFFLIPAAARFALWWRQGRPRYPLFQVLAVTWLVLPLVFFSLSESKLPGYILPAIPAGAIIVGLEIERLWSGESTRSLRLAALVAAILLLAVGAAFPFLLPRYSVHLEGPIAASAWLPLLASVLAATAFVVQRLRTFVLAAVSSVLVTVGAALVLAFPVVANGLSDKNLSLEVASALRPGEDVAFFFDRQYGPVFYVEGRVACGGKFGDVLSAPKTLDLVEALQSRPSLIVITEFRLIEWMEHTPQLSVSPIIACDKRECAVRITLRSGTALP